MISFRRMVISDFRVIASADVPLDNQGLVLISAVNNDTTAADSNGSGKSTIFHALGWCLYGKLIGEARPSDVIRRGAKKATVSVEWEVDGVPHKAERTATKTSTSLQLWVDEVSENGRNREDTEARICELLGLDFDSFRSTVMYGQGDFKRFASPNVTDADRKRILKQALNLGRMDAALKLARAKLKEARERHSEAATFLTASRAEHSRAQQRFTDAGEVAERWQDEQQRLIDELAAGVTEIDAKREELEATAGQKPRLVKLERDIQEQLAARTDLEERREELRKQLDRNNAEVTKATTALSTKTRRVSDAKSAIRAFDVELAGAKRDVARIEGDVEQFQEMDICPTCRTPTRDSQHAQAHLKKLEDQLQLAQDKLRLLVEQRPSLVDELSAAEREERSHQEGIEAARAALKPIQRSIAEIAEQMAELDAWKPKLTTVQSRLKDVATAERELGLLDERKSALKVRLREARAASNPHEAACDRARGELEKAREAMDEHQRDVDTIKAEMVPLEFWEEGFSNRGLPSLAMDAVMPILTESANRYLDILSDGDIQVDISTERDLKAGGSRDEITIRNRIEGNNDVRPSGAQESKIGIAIDLALMDMVASREGTSLDVLMIDEVLDGLDAEGKQRMFRLLDHLREVRSTILVISHDDDIKEHFERQWVVRKQDKASTLELDV